MKQLEIIMVRTPLDKATEARIYLQQIKKSIQGTSRTQCEIYINPDISGDLAFIAFITSKRPKNQENDLGLIVAEAMRHFGLVYHSHFVAAEDIPMPVFG